MGQIQPMMWWMMRKKCGPFAFHKQTALLTRTVLRIEYIRYVCVVRENERLEEVLIGKRVACNQIIQQMTYFVGWRSAIMNDSFAHGRCYNLLGYQVV
jgi:hypothetical protein